MARLRACLRRSGPGDDGAVFVSGDLRVDLARHQVMIDEARITLTRTEYELLAVLVRQAGKVLTHNQLLRAVWGTAYQTESHLLRVNISNLRRKIEHDPTRPQHILTEPGIGYRLNDA
jgi:two-component system KDP operon response regulator KdpE